MPIEFFELPQGAPSEAYITEAEGYCSVADVQALNWARTIGQGSNPGVAQVQTYIEMAAGDIDAILVTKGYSIPVNVGSWPDAGRVLNAINARGAVAMMEEASPNSPNLDRALAAWEAAKKMLADAKFVLNADMDQARSEPRGPWITYTPTGQTYDPMLQEIGGCYGDGMGGPAGLNNPALPYFSRQQRF